MVVGMEDGMAAVRAAKENLRAVMRRRLSQLSVESIAAQCP